jgi:hypothetical protein
VEFLGFVTVFLELLKGNQMKLGVIAHAILVSFQPLYAFIPEEAVSPEDIPSNDAPISAQIIRLYDVAGRVTPSRPPYQGHAPPLQRL